MKNRPQCSKLTFAFFRSPRATLNLQKQEIAVSPKPKIASEAHVNPLRELSKSPKPTSRVIFFSTLANPKSSTLNTQKSISKTNQTKPRIPSSQPPETKPQRTHKLEQTHNSKSLPNQTPSAKNSHWHWHQSPELFATRFNQLASSLLHFRTDFCFAWSSSIAHRKRARRNLGWRYVGESKFGASRDSSCRATRRGRVVWRSVWMGIGSRKNKTKNVRNWIPRGSGSNCTRVDWFGHVGLLGFD